MNLATLNGLRGVCCFWMLIFHCFLYSKLPIDLQGSSLMPTYFILSGLTLSVTDNKLSNDVDRISFIRFCRNRFARVFPTYYLCTLFALPVWMFNYGPFPQSNPYVILSILTSIIPVNTLFLFLFGSSIDGPGWTISSLAVLWLIYPHSAKKVRAYSNAQLVSTIVNYFYMQLGLVFVLFPVVLPLFGFWPAFCAATMNPISRYPLFMMGVCAGELCKRSDGKDLAWPKSNWLLFPCHNTAIPNKCDEISKSTEHPANGAVLSNTDDQDDTVKTTSKKAEPSRSEEEVRVSSVTSSTDIRITNKFASTEDTLTNQLDQTVAVYLFLTVAVSGLDTWLKFSTGDFTKSILGSLWLQALVPFIQLTIIVALTRCNITTSGSYTQGNSINGSNDSVQGVVPVPFTVRVLRSNMLNYLGRLSMTIYLTQWPVIYYTCLALRGPLHWPETFDYSTAYDQCDAEVQYFIDARSLPLWAIPVVVVATLGVSVVIFNYWEEPWRKLLRAP